MLIGLTYDLREEYLAAGYGEEETAEFDTIETIDAIDEALRSLGHETFRIGNVFSLIEYLARLGASSGLSDSRSGTEVKDRPSLIFNIAEGFRGLCREAQIPSILDAYGIPYTFSPSQVLALTLHKGWTKAVVLRAGVRTADYRVVESEEEIETIALPYPLFVKPVGGGTGMGIGIDSIIRGDEPDQLRHTVKDLLRAFKQPVLVERLLEGREFTVGVLGTGDDARVIGAMEICVNPESDDGIYSYKTKKTYTTTTEYRRVLGSELEMRSEITLKAWRALGCRDGGRVDLKMDREGSLNFIEVNPLAGLHPVDSDLPIICGFEGMSHQQLIGAILDSALSRYLEINL